MGEDGIDYLLTKEQIESMKRLENTVKESNLCTEETWFKVDRNTSGIQLFEFIIENMTMKEVIELYYALKRAIEEGKTKVSF